MNDDNTYKFMTNIIQHSRHRTRYVKQLKNVTIDAQVSYVRLFTSLAIALAIVLGVCSCCVHTVTVSGTSPCPLS